MKQLATAVALTCALITPLSFAATTAPKVAADASAADIWLGWSATADEPTTIPVDTAGHEAFVSVSVEQDYYYYDDSTNPALVQVLWNGKVVSGGDNIKPGNSIVFHVDGAGTLTIKNLTKDGYTDPWNNQTYPSTAYGSVILNIL